LFYDAARQLLRQRANCRIVLVGDHRARIPRDLKDCCRFLETGFIPQVDLDSYLGACDVMLAPMADTIASRARWPSKVNPMLSAGCATVVTRVGDLAELMELTDAGAVAECHADSVVAQVSKLLNDDALRQGYRLRARQLAEGTLAWPKLIAQLDQFYGDIIRRPA
jgi:glycosyltransferase involved in cell wall biosynthesis